MGFVGDSKTTSLLGSWATTLVENLNTDYVATRAYYSEDVPRGWAIGAQTVGTMKTLIDAKIAEHTYYSYFEKNTFFINLGINDFDSMPLEATWESDYLYIIDALRSKYPNAEIYITKPWMVGHTAEANTMAGWIDTIVAARAFCHVGDDERTWLEGGDNGATMTSDGVHYSAAGQIAKVAALRAVIGY